uniref:VLRF1 domain-containing protein n=1 Tax=Mola mola TaxID=94237 RepID=A0A3Q3W032_MOLML
SGTAPIFHPMTRIARPLLSVNVTLFGNTSKLCMYWPILSVACHLSDPLFLPPVSAEEFERKTGADMSSISGSESDSEEGDSDGDGGGTSSIVMGTNNETSVESSLITGRASSEVVFQNSAGQYLSVYRCILQGKAHQLSHLSTLSSHCVLYRKDVLQHKTFHRYTVRAKRGTAQGVRDSQNRSHAPKSAGAALRRHNEAALVKDIQDLLLNWVEHLQEASAIFIRAPSYNKTIFFGGRAAPLDNRDPRIRSLPFATRRPTFRETRRVHEVLSTVHVYGKLNYILGIITCYLLVALHPAEENHVSSDTDEGGEIQLEMVEQTLGTLDLRESEICPSRRRGGKHRLRNIPKVSKCCFSLLLIKLYLLDYILFVTLTQPSVIPLEVVDESWEYGLRDALFTACKVGDVDTLHRLLQLPTGTTENHPSDVPSPVTLLNKPVDLSGFTLLHVASGAAQKAVVRLLLDAGADPACRDNKGQTPYIVAPDKDTRNVFRKYMGENPDKYDYRKAQVPGALTAEIESQQLEKKKAQKALRKQREKEHKEEKKQQELEAEEKRRFASLTDREKRALAAERRLAEQVAATGVSLSNVKRCWLCGESLLGKIPFQYSEYSFCTTRCVQAHRKANTLSSKT